MRRAMGGTFAWALITESQMRDLTEAMLDAANVPQDDRVVYRERVNAMINRLDCV